MKGALIAALALRKVVYGRCNPIYVTLDTSRTGIGWEDEDSIRFAIRFGAKVLSKDIERAAARMHPS